MTGCSRGRFASGRPSTRRRRRWRSERTLLNWAWTCRSIPRSRRRESLSFSHHVLVAPLELEEQAIYFDRAEAEGLSSRELKLALDERHALGPTQDDDCADLDDIAAEVRDRLRDCYGEVGVEIAGAQGSTIRS